MTMITFVVLAAALAVVSAMYSGSVKHNKSLKKQVAEQSVIIDSLLKRKTYSFEVKLNVTDRSRNIVYGRYNRGTIWMPQEKIYELKIDSTSVFIK